MKRKESLSVRLGRRLLRSGFIINLLKRAAGSRKNLSEPDRIILQFQLDLVRMAYPGNGEKVVWANAFVPPELIWGLSLVPFYPEIASAVGAGLGLSHKSLPKAGEAHYSTDLCTFHRNNVGLILTGFYPGAGAYVCTSNLCDVAGQMFANFAYENQKPFFLIDVPQDDDEESLEYVEGQLEELIEMLTTSTGAKFDPERLREAVRLSNQALEYAEKIDELRTKRPSPLRGSAMLNRLGAMPCVFGHPDGVAYYRALYEYARDLAERGESEQPNQKIRLYWMHLRPYFSTDLFTHLEDELGVLIAFEEFGIWWKHLDKERPLRSLARKIMCHSCHGPIERRVEKVLRDVERFDVDGVVHFNHWGCRQSTGSLQVIRERLKEHGIPFLQIEGDCIDATNLQIGPLRTRIEAFVEMLA